MPHTSRAQDEGVARPRLVQRLLDGISNRKPFSLICGPAGCGKTTLLGQFAASLDEPVGWLSLDEDDNDAGRFWRYVVRACQTAAQTVGAAAWALLEETELPPAETVATLLINDFAALDVAHVLVLDDYHLIHSEKIHAGVSYLLEHAPPTFHVVISTRVDPPFALARFRARNQLVELRERDLRFTLEEAASFLKDVTGLQLAAKDVKALAKRTEGWIAGLQLAAIAMRTPVTNQAGDDYSAFIERFAGSHVYVAEYLLDEVWRRQPEAVREFLQQTSILERLNGDLCDTVTGWQGGREMLATLQRANLFVVPLDDVGAWFRYHHLFADLLRARLAQTSTAQNIAALHVRAAAWYEQNGFVEEAIGHGLAAGDIERVAALVQQEARGMMSAGRASTLNDWLAVLPDEAFASHPGLEIYRLWIDLMQGRANLTMHMVEEKERLLRSLPPSPENDRLWLEMTVVLCRFVALSGNTTKAISLAEEALANLAQEDVGWRARAHSALAIAYMMEGQVEAAARAHEASIRMALAHGNYSLAAHGTMMRAMEESDYGQLRKAARSYQSIIDMGEQAGRKIFFPAGQGYVGLAGIYVEWNELDAAETLLEKGMTLCRQGGLAGLETGHALRARLRQAKGDLKGALTELQSLAPAAPGGDPAVTVRFISLQLLLGDVEGAWRVAMPLLHFAEGNAGDASAPLLLAEIYRLIGARLFLATGELDRSWQLLRAVEATAAPARRHGRLIEVYLLEALAYLKQQHGAASAGALKALQQALTLGEAEGYCQLFLEAGEALVPLLAVLAQRSRMPVALRTYARRLLEALNGKSRWAGAGWQAAMVVPGLIEPLTAREREVLELIVAGDSNRAIADRLVITVRTVKKHASNIYSKLNVSSRTQAVARARELGLLPPELP